MGEVVLTGGGGMTTGRGGGGTGMEVGSESDGGNIIDRVEGTDREYKVR